MLFIALLARVAYRIREQLVETDWLPRTPAAPASASCDMRQGGYDDGHVPGAVCLSPVAIRDANSPPTFLPTPAAFDAMMARLGISDATRVVVYDEARRHLRRAALVDPELLRPLEASR